MKQQRLQLRSYRLAFQLERRIHRIDRFRIPLPYGLPLSALAWWSAALVIVLLAARLPLMGALLGLLPWPVRLVLLPAAVARQLCVTGQDGRPAWERAGARARWELRVQSVVAFERKRVRSRERLRDVVVGSDEGAPCFRPAKVRGGGAVHVRRPARGLARRGCIELAPAGDRWLAVARRIELPGDAKLVITCGHR